MDCTLTRVDYSDDGVSSVLEMLDGTIFFTLEHAYSDGLGNWLAKIPPGIYQCVIGQHKLHNMKAPFVAYEITAVPNHTGILFHVGNFNEDSEGCVLLGLGNSRDMRGRKMVLTSHLAFTRFMKLQNFCKSFSLLVR